MPSAAVVKYIDSDVIYAIPFQGRKYTGETK